MRPKRLKVFVSSLLSLKEERKSVVEALRTSDLADDWVFEGAPASSASLTESYLREVRECDLMVLLLRETISGPVRSEYLEAKKYTRPVLVFVDETCSQDADVCPFLESEIEERYRSYRNLNELKSEVVSAIREELILTYQRATASSVTCETDESKPKTKAKIGRVKGDLALGNMVKGEGIRQSEVESSRDLDVEVESVEGDVAGEDLCKDSN